MSSVHETMRLLGLIAAQVYPDRELPANVMNTLLANPSAGFPLMTRKPLKGAAAQLAGELPAELPITVSIEDQGGFWLGWYGNEGKRGGARPGAGRPAGVEGTKRINVMLDPDTIEQAKALGDGNLSAGIRSAVAAAARNAAGAK